MKSNVFYKIIITLVLIVSGFFVYDAAAHAAINKEINYQGKITDSSNAVVADGTYAMEFKLYTQLSGGSAIWTETLTGANEVQVTNGLFSVMLGAVTPFTGVDFNQTLYLGVNIESDGEMSPRKIVGAVPAAFVADTLDNLSSEQFLRSDAQNATSSSNTFLNILQTGAGKIAEFFGSASQSVLALLSNGNVGIGTSTPYAKLSVSGQTVSEYFTATSTTASSLPYASSTALTVSGALYNPSLSDGCLNVASGLVSSTGAPCGGSGSQTPWTANIDGAGFDLGNAGTVTAENFIATSSSAASVFPYASTTALTVSGTDGFTLGSLTGPLQAINGAVSATSTLSTFYGGTGLSTAPTYGQLLLGNALGGYTLTATSTLGLVQSSDLASYLSLAAWFATTTDILDEGVNNLYWTNNRFDSRLSATTTLPNITTLLGMTDFISTRATTTNSTTTNFYISSTIAGAGLSSCSGSGDKLIWNSTTRQFSCGADAGAGGGLTALGAQYSSFQTGSSQTFATSSDTNISLSITSSGDIHTFTPSWIGTLASGRGGTGISSVTANQLLVGNSGGTGWTQVATSSLGLLTTNVAEGSNLYYTDARVNSYIHASTTIPKLYTANTFTGLQTFTGGLTTSALTLGSLTGPLQALNGVVSATSTLSTFYGGTGLSTAPTYGQLLLGNALGGYTLTATSSLGLTSSQWTTNASDIYYTTGNVGIGSTTPFYKLSVEGDASIANNVRANYFTATSTTASTFPVLREGEIAVVHSNGSVSFTYATTSTDTGRGIALNTAYSSAISGDTIFVAPGAYAVINSVFGKDKVNWYFYASSTITATPNVSTQYFLFSDGGDSSTGSLTPMSFKVKGNGRFIIDASNTNVGSTGIVITSNGNSLVEFEGDYAYAKQWDNDASPIWNATGTMVARVKQIITPSNYCTITQGGVLTTYTEYMSCGLDSVLQTTGGLQYLYADEVIHNGSGSAFKTQLGGRLYAYVKHYTATDPSHQGLAWSISDTDQIYLYGNELYGATDKTSVTPGAIIQVNEYKSGANFATVSGNVGIGTTTPYAKLSVVGEIVGSYFTGTTTATSTFGGNLAINGTGTTTSAGGFNLSAGCFAVNGTCLTNSTYGDSSVNSYIHASTTIPKTYTANTFTGLQTFTGGLTTSALTLGSLTGPLQAINGAVSATSTLSTFYGGTGLSTAPTYGQLLLGNALGGYTLTATSSLGLLSSSAISSGTTGQIPYYAADGSELTATSSLFIATNGDVGIGTSTPSSKLAISGGNITHTAFGNPTLEGSIVTGGFTSDVYIFGKYSYSADGSSGLQIVDISNPALPLLVGTYSTGGSATGIYVSGKYAYIAAGSSGIMIIDISNPALPLLVGTYNTSGSATDIYVSGKYAYVADGSVGGFQIIDISNPASPSLVGTYSTGGTTLSVYVSGKYAYVGDSIFGLFIIDISNPASPSFVGTYNTSGSANDIYVSGKYAYVADGASGLEIINISNSASPSLTSAYNTDGSAGGVYVSGKYAYVADGSVGGIQVVDISSSTVPWLVGTYDTSGSSNGIFVSGKYAYVSDGSSGVSIIDINGTETPSLYAGNIETNVLNATENINAGGDIYAGGGLNVGISGIFSRGTISAFIASTTQTNPVVANFMGGNVGIGTTTPYAKLSVVGEIVGSYFTGTTTATSTFGGNLAINGTGTTTSAGGFNISAGCYAIGGTCLTSSTYGNSDVNSFIHASTTIPKTYTANTFTGAQSFTGAFSVGSGPNVFNVDVGSQIASFAGLTVGIGTQNPTRSLTLNSTDAYMSFNNAEVEKWIVGNEGSASDRFSIYNITESSYAFNIDHSNNNIGFGTTSPGTKLSLGNTGANTVNISTTATSTFGFGLNLREGCFAINGNCMTIGSGTTGQVPYYDANGGALSATSSLFIASTGNIGIGTTSPYAKLSVVGEVVAANFTATSTASSTISQALTVGGTYTPANLLEVGATSLGYQSGFNGISISSQSGQNGTLRVGQSSTAQVQFRWDYSATPSAAVANLVTYGYLNPIRIDASILSLQASSNANVGIGDTGPDAKLEVSASAGATDPFMISSNDDTNGDFFIVKNTTGNVGIGTTSPVSKLSVAGDINIDKENYLRYNSQPLITASTTLNNYFFGNGGRLAATGQNNTAVGYHALNAVTSGEQNTALGTLSAQSITTGSYNTVFGYGSLAGNASDNTAFGRLVLANNSGYENVGVGNLSLNANTTGYENTAIGRSSGRSNTTGNLNTFIGFSAGYTDGTTATQNNLTNASAFGTYAQVTASNSLVLGGTGAYGVNVGIGTTSPYAKLSVVGQVVASHFTSTSTTASTFPYASTTAITVATQAVIGDDADFTDAFGPHSLYVAGPNGKNVVAIGNTENTLRGAFYLDTGNNSPFQIGTITTHNLGFFTNNASPQMTAYTSGALGIGSYGNLADANDVTNGLIVSGNVGIGTSSPYAKFSVAGSSHLGGALVATGTASFSGLTGSTGAGSICLSSNNELVYNSGSDACLPSLRETKHDIKKLSLDALSVVNDLIPTSFVYNDGDQRLRYGFIAEDTQEIDEHLVTYNAQGDLSGIDDRAMTSLLVKAVKEQQLQIEELAMNVFDGQVSSVASSTTSTTASILTEDKSFIARIAQAVKEMIETTSEWVVSKITAQVALFDRIETKVAAVSRGLEMKDQANGKTYCVSIVNGDWDKAEGSCSDSIADDADEEDTNADDTRSSNDDEPVNDNATTTPEIVQDDSSSDDQATTTDQVEESSETSTTETVSSGDEQPEPEEAIQQEEVVQPEENVTPDEPAEEPTPEPAPEPVDNS